MHDKLLNRRHQHLTTAQLQTQQRVSLAVVVVCHATFGHACALLIDHLSCETDEILHIEFIVVRLVGLDFD